MPQAVLTEEGQYPDPATPQAKPTLKIGSKGPDVEVLQAKLTKFGYSLTIDGDFGPRTEGAVKAFQTAKNLVIDGIVADQTWTALG
jgi:peptidoglycan hydrolase-like protein with peptidoglycan-binding domain